MPEWDYKALAFFLSLINSVVLVATIIYAHLINKQKVNAASIQIEAQRITSLDKRMVVIEKAIDHMPDHEDIANLNSRISELAQGVTKMEGTVEAIDNTVHLIHDHLLNKK